MAIEQSAGSWIKKVRHPRVQLCYDLDSPQGRVRVELPLVMGVMADLSGDADRLDEVPEDGQAARGGLERRRFITIDVESFDNVLKAMKPRVALSIPQTLTDEGGEICVDITFESLSDFSPARIARKVMPLNKLLGARARLKELLAKADMQAHPTDLAGALHGIASQDAALSDLLNVLIHSIDQENKRSPQLAQDWSENLIGRIDSLVEVHVNRILHHPTFQHLEGTWRGLHFLVRETETNRMLKIKVLNISKKQLADALIGHKGAHQEQSLIYERISELFAIPGGEPFGCLIGCRFAHYLLAIVRDRIGKYVSRDDLQQDLQAWLDAYVAPDVNKEASVERFLLSEARITVEEDPHRPETYLARLYLRPNIQLEPGIGLTLVLRFPTMVGGLFGPR